MPVSEEMVERALSAYEAKMLELHSENYKGAEPISVSAIRSLCLRAALTAALSDQVVGNGWQDISTAPKDGTKILAFAPNHPDRGPVFRLTWWRRPEDQGGYVGWGEFNTQYWPPTHWQPLPAPPSPPLPKVNADAP